VDGRSRDLGEGLGSEKAAASLPVDSWGVIERREAGVDASCPETRVPEIQSEGNEAVKGEPQFGSPRDLRSIGGRPSSGPQVPGLQPLRRRPAAVHRPPSQLCADGEVGIRVHRIAEPTDSELPDRKQLSEPPRHVLLLSPGGESCCRTTECHTRGTIEPSGCPRVEMAVLATNSARPGSSMPFLEAPGISSRKGNDRCPQGRANFVSSVVD
jgi:hypothetical protein